ncbi:TrmB family transcriptional regulator [Candidatus Woesearchaeota archaeon]|nr:TrmB family transcriptional regulator [Candidatus Woesearchaeota archaeon]
MAQQTFINALKQQFDLNIYEAKIWTALLSRGVASAAELAEISKVPRSRCYDVLESLEKKGFIIMKIGKPIEYIAVKPDVIIDRVKKDREDEAKAQVALLDSVKKDEVFGELELLHRSGIKHVDISTISKSIVGRTAINKQVKALLRGAQSRVILVSDAQGVEKNAKPLKSLIPQLRKKGAEVTVYAPHDKRLAKKLSGVKYVDFKSDSSFILSSSGIVPEYEVAIWLESPFFVHALQALFEMSAKSS